MPLIHFIIHENFKRKKKDNFSERQDCKEYVDQTIKPTARTQTIRLKKKIKKEC